MDALGIGVKWESQSQVTVRPGLAGQRMFAERSRKEQACSGNLALNRGRKQQEQEPCRRWLVFDWGKFFRLAVAGVVG